MLEQHALETDPGKGRGRSQVEDVAAAYARSLLSGLGLEGDLPRPAAFAEHPMATWARSGAMALTGPADGPPAFVAPALASAARGALLALAALTESDPLSRLDGAALLGERAALEGLARSGRVSPGGSCRLLQTLDGWIAANLARPEDVRCVPAWLGEAELGDPTDPWAFVAERVSRQPTDPVVERARLLGLPVARAEARVEPAAWLEIRARGTPRLSGPSATPLVIDLSSLWAGPLCTHLLALSGARVVKVESESRPDGARAGSPQLFDLLNGGVESVALDLRSQAGRKVLSALVARADVVVESARPRALAQLGIDAKAMVDEHGLTWLSITGYGRAGRLADRVAFGDDAAAAAGLAFAALVPGAPLFCADAIADPLAGIHGALAVASSLRRGRGELVDVSLRNVGRHAAGFHVEREAPSLAKESGRFESTIAGETVAVGDPRGREATQPSRPLGGDTDALLRELVPGC